MRPVIPDREARMARLIAEKALEHGGRAYYVGGAVRDGLLGRPCKDIDIELHRISPGTAGELLSSLGERLEYGRSFGIFSLKGFSIDISLPRKEASDGSSPDLRNEADPEAGILSSVLRRDLTVNAMMQDILTGEVLDPLGGQKDLRAGVLRAVSPRSFRQDPLRVFRCARFAAVLGFSVEEGTLALGSGQDLSGLAMERVFGEVTNALLHAQRPSVFLQVLRKMGQLDLWFPEVKALIGLPLPDGGPGDAWDRTLAVLDRAAALRGKAPRPSALMLSALFCGASGAPAAGEPERNAERFLQRLTTEKALTAIVTGLCSDCAVPARLFAAGAGAKETGLLFDRSPDPDTLLLLCRALYPEEQDLHAFLRDRLSQYRSAAALPGLTGQDLIDAGLSPGKDFSRYLSLARGLHLAGVPREEQLKEVLRLAGLE